MSNVLDSRPSDLTARWGTGVDVEITATVTDADGAPLEGVTPAIYLGGPANAVEPLDDAEADYTGTGGTGGVWTIAVPGQDAGSHRLRVTLDDEVVAVGFAEVGALGSRTPTTALTIAGGTATLALSVAAVVNTGGPGGSSEWGDITGDIGDQADLQEALAEKADEDHTHPASDIPSGVFAPARLGSGTPGAGKYVDGGTGAWTDLPSGGTVAWGDVTGKPTEFPPEGHEHVIADVTGLQAALDAKEATGAATAAVSAHVGATDPHGDRAYTDAEIAALTYSDVGAASAAQGALADSAVQPDEYDTDQGMPGLNRGGSALWKVESGDLFMAAGGVSGGVVQSGALRGVQGLLIEPATYTQSAKPTDRLVGSPMTVLWNATIGEGGGLGPEAQTTYFGPRPAVNLEGIVRYSRNQTSYGFSPVGFGDVLAVGNNAGAARTIVPSWPFMCARIYFADGATVTHGPNDVGDGGAAFVDAQILATQNGGTWDGVTNDSQLISFLSVPSAVGEVDLFGRIAFDVTDFTDPANPSSPGAVRAAMGEVLGGTIDAQAVSVVENVGLRVQPMSVGTHNIGIRNAAGLVEDPIALTVTASSTIPRNATLVHLTAASAVDLNSTPIIGTGLPGQVIRLINVGSNMIRLLGELAGGGENGTAGTGVRNRVTLAAGESTELRWIEAEARWVPTYHSSPTVQTTDGAVQIYSATNRRYPEVSFGVFFGVPYMTMGPGGASTESVALTRTAPNPQRHETLRWRGRA